MAEKEAKKNVQPRTGNKVSVSWKFEPEYVAMLKAIAKDADGASEALILRSLIKKEFIRRKLSVAS